MLSNVVGIVITPYTTESLNYGFLVVMQSIWISNDWDPATSPQLLQDMVVDFEGYINFNDAGAEYKFTSGREYAAGATAGTIATSGANLKIQAGYYKMEVDTEKLTYKVTAVRGNG
jgi:hypothetical protein